MSEATHFGVRLVYENGKYEDFDLVKAPPEKVVLYSWGPYDEATDNSDLIREERDGITPQDFYEFFLPSKARYTGIELISPNGHRMYLNRHSMASAMLVPIKAEA